MSISKQCNQYFQEHEPWTLLKKGEKTTLVLYNNPLWTPGPSAQGLVGFAVDEFGVAQLLAPGATARVEFTPDRSGEFRYYDPVNVGAGQGTLTVEP